MFDQKLRRTLQRMVNADQQMRKKAWKTGFMDTTVDRRNTRTLRSIVQHQGWPAPAAVGKIGARNAWLLAQHADLDPPFQREFLREMKIAQRRTPHPYLEESIGLLQDRISHNVRNIYRLIRLQSIRRRSNR